jgi:anti-sigma factor RsiW
MKCFNEMTYMLFLDDELPGEKAHQISHHLKRCPQCRKLVQRLHEENTGISSLFALDHPVPDQAQLIFNRINTVPKSPSRFDRINFPHLVRGMRIATLLLLIFLLSVFIFLNKKPAVSNLVQEVLLQSARVEGHSVQTHVFNSGDTDITFIWLEKI